MRTSFPLEIFACIFVENTKYLLAAENPKLIFLLASHQHTLPFTDYIHQLSRESSSGGSNCEFSPLLQRNPSVLVLERKFIRLCLNVSLSATITAEIEEPFCVVQTRRRFSKENGEAAENSS